MNAHRLLGRLAARVLLGLLVVLMTTPASAARVRVKDVADVVGVRGNQLIGVGLVTGLNGTGDKSSTKFTNQAIENLLKRFNITVPAGKLKTKNDALVVVTTTLPPFVRQGTKIDVTVSALGDAKSLEGGVLLLTPLVAVDGLQQPADAPIYALAQGPVSIGGFLAGLGGRGGATVTKGHTTVGRVPNGATVEREVPMEISDGKALALCLRRPDFTSALRLAEAINAKYRGSAVPTDAATVSVLIPKTHQGAQHLVAFVSSIEALTLTPDSPATIVINERTGTIISGSDATVSAVDITHGSITVTVESDLSVVQPPAFSQGLTAFVEKIFTKVEEQPGRSTGVREGAKAGEVAKLLSDMGVPPRDIIAIFQMLKKAGKLQADLIIQ